MKVRHLIPLIVVGLVGCEPEPRDISTLILLEDGVRNGWVKNMWVESPYFDRDTLSLYQGTFISPEDREPYSGPVFFSRPDTVDDFVDHFFGPFDTLWYVFGDRRNSYTGNLKDGLFHGPLERYYKNGQLEVKSSFSNGEWVGPYEMYYENGQLQQKSSYSNGLLHGPWEDYYENGQLMAKGSYSNGEEVGPWEYYYENGQLEFKVSGEPCGEYENETQTYAPCPSN